MEREITPKLVFGVTYSYNSGISDRRGRQSGTILYLDTLGNELLPDYQKFGVDFLFKYRGFSMYGEYVNAKAFVPGGIKQRVRNDGSAASTFLVNGVQDVPNYVKARMIVGSGYSVQAGYLFQSLLSLDFRYSHLDPESNSFLNNGTFYNRPDYFSLCASKYISRNYGAKIQASVTYNRAKTGSLSPRDELLKGEEFSGAIMLTLSL
jgi:hypothetical protein